MIFNQYCSVLTIFHNILHHFYWKHDHFTCFTILERYIIRITDYYYDAYLSIYAWFKSGGSFDAKVKVKDQGKYKGINDEFLIVIDMCVY